MGKVLLAWHDATADIQRPNWKLVYFAGVRPTSQLHQLPAQPDGEERAGRRLCVDGPAILERQMGQHSVLASG